MQRVTPVALRSLRHVFIHISTMAGEARVTRRSVRTVTTASKKAEALASTVAAAPSPAPSSAPSVSASSSEGIPTLTLEDAAAWETWLETNHGETAGVWLRIAKKGAFASTVTYDGAVDIALCYGWIDGQRKALDASFFVQRFTPRRKNSIWSKRNVDKVASLLEAGRMRGPGQAEVDAAMADGRWERAYAGSSTIEVPPDFQAALDKDRRAAKFFATLNKTQRYSFLWRIETTKKEDTRRRKIGMFVEMLAEQKTVFRG